jgi:hypothetical protein
MTASRDCSCQKTTALQRILPAGMIWKQRAPLVSVNLLWFMASILLKWGTHCHEASCRVHGVSNSEPVDARDSRCDWAAAASASANRHEISICTAPHSITSKSARALCTKSARSAV